MSFRKIFKSYIVPALLIVAGIFAFKAGHYFAALSSTRAPAALHPKTYDFSGLNGESLQSAIKDRLVMGTRVITAGPEVGIELGHFTTKNSNGDSVSACNQYKNVEIIFEAGDMAVSGELPRMIVTGPCITDDDLGVISPLMIQMQKIIPSQVMDRKFASTFEDKATVAFENVSDSWPHVWVVRTIRLYNSQEEITANIDDFRRILGKTVSFEWVSAE